MMKMRKLRAFILAAALLLLIPVSVHGAEWTGEDFTITIPDDVYIFTPETPVDDAAWALAGITDPRGTLETYSEMSAVAEIVSKDGQRSILLGSKSNDYAKQVYNLADLSQEEKNQVLEDLATVNSDTLQVERGIYDGGETPFFWITFDGEDTEGNPLHEILYGTIFNGKTLTLDIFNPEGITQEDKQVLEDIADSFVITKVIPVEEMEETAGAQTVTAGDIILMGVLLGAMVLLVAGTFLFIRLKDKKDKKKKKALAERLSKYRKDHSGESEIRGELRYANLTHCSDPTIHEFSLYHAYKKNILPIASGILLSFALVALAFYFNTEWFMRLISLALVVYYGYKLITSSSSIEKVQHNIYSRGNNRAAKYAFYDEMFRVAGIQSPAVYPYFQITEVRRNKNYAYLYYGPDNAYIVDMEGFESGDRDSFYSFIQSKIGKGSEV